MAQLVMSVRNNDVIIAKSDVMKVHWSGEYTLDVAADITNCPDGRIKVYYKRPPCVPPSDIIEVVAMGNDGNISLLTNHTLSGDENFVQFECSSIFKDLQSAVICFRYMTLGVALRTVCRQTNHSVEFNVSGSWTTWSYWSQCQRPCSETVSRRTRTCDNPKPMGMGKHCSKDSASNIDYEFEESDVSNSECEFGTPMTSTNTSSCTC
uniref:Uncharacterized protein n=1 Tax=Ciona savignyi TaxID=51511 RepID=H2ZQ84_CIOSA